MTIPEEFRSRSTTNATADEAQLSTLFDDDEGEEENLVEVSIEGNQIFRVVPPPDKGTLFAHRVWSGSKLMANYILSHVEEYVTGKTTIEFGAGTAIPSLTALSLGTRYSLITDYPDDEVLQSIRETVGHNWQPKMNNRVKVLGHEWGGEVDCLLESSGVSQFDVAFLSECLWMHNTHQALAQSLDRVLHPTHGIAILTYAHHVPGYEAEDDAFFKICESKYGMSIAHACMEKMEYMWNSDKTIAVYLKVLKRKA